MNDKKTLSGYQSELYFFKLLESKTICMVDLTNNHTPFLSFPRDGTRFCFPFVNLSGTIRTTDHYTIRAIHNSNRYDFLQDTPLVISINSSFLMGKHWQLDFFNQTC